MKTSLVAVLVLSTGCASQHAASPGAKAAAAAPPGGAAAAQRSLYDRLGGTPAITAVVEEFVARDAADKRINARFINTDIPKLKGLLVDFICGATGGPCTYAGRDMYTAHASMNLVEEEFNALVEDLVGALQKLNVPAKEQGEILTALGGLKPQIVNPPPPSMAQHDPALVQKGRQLAAQLRKAGKTQSADLLEVALDARTRGQRNYAEQLFSAAELGAEANALAALDPLFRQGAPARITTKLRTLPADTPPQPKEAVGNSDDEEQSAPQAAQPKRASLEGSVKLEGKPLSHRMAVVMLTPLSGKYARRPARHRVIEQRERQFAPHIMAVPVGSTVAFPNFDKVYHNVFSLSKTRSFDLGIYKNGETRDVTFDQEGFIRLGCNMHANMSAYLIVVAAPHYVPTDGSGHFRFAKLVPGKYKMRTWIEGLNEPIEQAVAVKDGENKLDVEGQGMVASDLGMDKFGVSRGAAKPQ
jgi:hemoglobin